MTGNAPYPLAQLKHIGLRVNSPQGICRLRRNSLENRPFIIPAAQKAIRSNSSDTWVCMHSPASHEGRKLSSPSSRQSPTRPLTRKEMAVDYALGDWALFDRTASAWEDRFYTPRIKRRRRASPVVVPEESSFAEAAAVAAFLNSPDAAWNWLPCNNRGVSWKQAQVAGLRLGVESFQSPHLSSSRSRSPGSLRTAPANVVSNVVENSDVSPAMVSFDGSIGTSSEV